MRLRRLDLDLFGHFTGKVLDFGPRPGEGPDFHVIHGANEAGKTTVMEGYLRLLYGFAHREPYDFLHQRRNLAVAGVLELDGREVFHARRPVRAGSLVDANGAAVPETALQAALAGLAQEDYRKLLCLDDETIEKGGEEIANSRGEIGRLLFSAAAGIGGLSQVLDRVQEEARALHLKGSGKTRFATVRRALEEVAARIGELDVTAGALRGLRQAVETARQEEQAAGEGRAALHRERAQAAALAAALPVLERHDALAARLEPLAHYPARVDIDPEDLVRMLAERTALDAGRARLEQQIAALDAALAEPGPDAARLGLAQELAPLDALRSRCQTAGLDLPRRRQALAETGAQMRRCADELGLGEDADPRALVLPPARLAELEEVRDTLLRARAEAAREAKELAGLAEQIAQIEAEIAARAARAPAGGEVLAVLDRYDAAGLAQAHAVAQNAAAEATRRTRAALAALSHGGAEFDAPPALPMTAADAEALAQALRGRDGEREGLGAQLDDARARRAAAAATIGALRSGTGIVPDGEAVAAREARDRLWSAHRAALSAPTADQFAAAMHAVDAIAERRLSHAADLGRLRQLEQDLAAQDAEIGELERRAARPGAEAAAIRARLDAVAVEAGLAARLSPEGLVRWLRALETAREQVAEQAALRAAQAGTLARAEALRAALAPHLGAAAEGDFADVLAAATRLAEGHRAHRQALETAEARRADQLRARAGRERAAAAAGAALAAAERAWEGLVAALLGGQVSARTALGSLEPLRRLRELAAQCAEVEQRIATMEADREAFAAQVAGLAARHGLAAGDCDPLALFDALRAAGEAARAAADRRAELGAERAKAEAALAGAGDRLAGIAARIAELGAGFDPRIPTGSLEALREAVATGRTVQEDRARLGELHQQLLSRLGLDSIEEVRAALAGLQAPELDARLSRLDADLGLAEDRYRAAIAARAAAETGLGAVTGGADVAVLVEERRTLELELQEIALEHLELQLGHRLAEEAIRRYRDRHRSAMLEATERAFAGLTNGAYSRLQTRPEGSAEVLVALDAAGMAKQAGDLSKGTRFQLYLALRAAAYEQMAANGVVLPFFCDDIFETFDEARTRAACALMARIGRTGQAIYLTHHRHVVEIAREVCGTGVRVQEI